MDAQGTMLNVMADEIKTILRYKELLEESGCPACKSVLTEIITDEFMHIGCALQVLTHNPEVAKAIEDGKQEAIESIHKNEAPAPMI